jgi:alpha-glucosidase (family GH31 glycosyl hydrolase)
VCPVDRLCEAEKTTLAGGVSVASDHSGFTGTGFAAGFLSVGASLTYQLDVPSAGTYDLRLRYANSVGGDGGNTTRTLSAAVDGADATTLKLPTTADWNTWSFVSTPLSLSAGRHTLVISRGANDSGNVNIDSLAVTAPGAPYPSPVATAVPCDYGTVCEAEDGALTGGAKVGADHNGYAGGGFVAGLEQAGATDAIALRNVPADGRYALQLRYANASGSARTVSTAVNGGAATSSSLPVTADWDSWSTVTIPVTLTKGSDTVAIGCPSADSCHVNLDTVAVTSTTSPTLPAHSPLGGYRRGLDGVDGSAVTTPGLLYRDGWYLLDDTASALYDPATRAVHQRPAQKTYQDSYLFGYGQDYKRGLADLATLTGPPNLLPRWAYGVWFSEYYDFTAADYENTVLPRFRSEKVPLDVLVTDTDYKSPSTWNGWEMDPKKFPDPAAFFDWSARQGLHNTLNIHPSIGSDDAQYAAAQATAGGKLAASGCTADAGQTCHVFDWGDPAQLKAYLNLHQTMEKQGADFWWLDWCCEDSRSSLPGVTPDAWINQQYADDTAKNVGRGFAFSRAFGSLQASGYSGQAGVPTGPWADKRTTVHFTGDTTSSWDTLRFEVGYTPGESAATGLSAVSHDIGGFNGPSHLADDLYVRWVQMSAFQPILRLHGNHSDRLPWQYGDQARTAAEKFLNLRENLVPYTYGLAREASVSGIPVVRATYLEYPDQPGAYDAASREYFYGSDVLVAPATSAGTSSTTPVWFPPGRWTDYFTGKTYTGPSVVNVTSDWNSMPVFVKAGGIVPTRTDNVTNDVQNPLNKVTLTVSTGADGTYSLYEDDGRSASKSATTRVRYTDKGHTLRIDAAKGSFDGQVAERQWTAVFTDAGAPSTVRVDGAAAPAGSWKYDPDHRTLTVTVPARSIRSATTISYG